VTTETASKIETMEKALADAIAAFDAANLAAATATKALLAEPSPDYAKLAEIGAPVKRAERVVDDARATLKVAKNESVWGQLDEIRSPVLATIRESLVTDVPTLKLASALGHINIPEDNDAVVTLTLTFEKADSSEIAALIAMSVDGEAFRAQGITDIDFSVADIGGLNTIDLKPTAAVAMNDAGKRAAATGVRGGSWSFTYEGKVLGSREFLEAVEASGAQIAKDRAPGFETALRGSGNGLRNLAIGVAKSLNVPASQTDKADTTPAPAAETPEAAPEA
jgi:hypothetical protein